MSEDISLSAQPSIHYEKFFAKFSDIEILPIEKWDTTLIVAYFCKLYRQHYNTDYTFRYNNSAPSKSYEVFQMRKLASMLSANPIILKGYIDWFFATKIVLKKKRITSMAFLTDANTVNEYKFSNLLMGKQVIVDRNTVIPSIYGSIVNDHGFAFTNYGELSFIKRCVSAGNAEPNHKTMLNALQKAGMDLSILDKVK